ncbi:MAG: HEAT repeat domain-containing protein [Gemmataceae bacterium]
MSKRRLLLWLGIAVIAAAGVAVLVPDSPAYLTNLWGYEGQHDGHYASHWIHEADSPDTETRRNAIFALGAIGPQAGSAVPKLAKIMLEDPEGIVRNEAAFSLSKMTPASKTAVPALVKALNDEIPLVRMNAALALMRLETDAQPAVPDLLKALQDKTNDTNINAFHATVRQTIMLAAGKASAGTMEAIEPLSEELKNAHGREETAICIRALGYIGPAAKSVTPQLRPFLKDKDRWVQEATADALERIEGTRPQYVQSPLEKVTPTGPRAPGGGGQPKMRRPGGDPGA